MGCGQSTDGYSNHGDSPKALQSSVADSVSYPAHNNNNNNATEKEAKIDKATLEEFIRLEKEIAAADSSNPLRPLELKSEQLQKLNLEIEKCEENLKVLEEQTRAYSGGTPGDTDIRKYLLEVTANFKNDDSLTQEQERLVDDRNKQEIAARELASMKEQRGQLVEEISELDGKAKVQLELYAKQEKMLQDLFGGEYGSMLENKLEGELYELQEHRARILEANFKWRQAQVMLEYACKQLAIAVQNWAQVLECSQQDLEKRYGLAAETRNNLVASGQNVQGAQKYLDNVQFPYCQASEVVTLNRATEYVFTDMQSLERHEHAMQCYSTTHRRCAALLQWFASVITATILKDLHDINDKIKGKSLELRKERTRLIKDKVHEIWGTNIELDETLRAGEIDAEAMSKMVLDDKQVIKVDGGSFDERERALTPTPLTVEELAPVPSNSVVFGDNMYDHYQNQVKDITEQHEVDMELYNKGLQMKEKQAKNALEDKLMQRRQRRARAKIEEMEIKALTK